jgi:hypothetical protein
VGFKAPAKIIEIEMSRRNRHPQQFAPRYNYDPFYEPGYSAQFANTPHEYEDAVLALQLTNQARPQQPQAELQLARRRPKRRGRRGGQTGRQANQARRRGKARNERRRRRPKRERRQEVRAEAYTGDVSPLQKFYEGIDDPWGVGTQVKSPFNYNLAPSPKSVLNKTTATFKFQVQAMASAQITMFPGHGKLTQQPAGVGGASDQPTVSLDLTANHAMIQNFGPGPTRYVCGPITEEQYSTAGTTFPCAIGGLSVAVGLEQFVDTSASMTPIIPDVGSPYNGSLGQEQEYGEHMRYKMVNQGMIVTNVTKNSDRGGNVVSVMPEYQTLPPLGNQSKLRMYSSWHDHGVGEIPIVLNTAQRPQDLSFWHKAPMAHLNSIAANSTASVNHGALHVFFNNTTNAVQTYAVNIVQNYQISGQSVEVVSTLNPHEPAHKGTYETIVTSSRTLQASASGFAKTARALADSAYKTVDGSMGTASKLLASAASGMRMLTKAGAAAGFAVAAL